MQIKLIDNTPDLYNDIDAFMKHFLAEFHPCAYYHPSVDTICVRLVDASFCEVRLNQYLSILRKNHGNPDSIVGFDITNVHALFERIGIKPSGNINIADILHAFEEKLPCVAIQQIKKTFMPFLVCEKLKVKIGVPA